MDRKWIEEIYLSKEFQEMAMEDIVHLFYMAAIDLHENDEWQVEDMSNSLDLMREGEYYEAIEGVKSAITVIKFIQNT